MIKKILIILGIVLMILVGIVLVFTFLGPKQPKPVGVIDDIESLERYFEEMVEADYPPTLSIAVMKRGELVYNKGFGYIDDKHTIKTSETTVYPWWSTTKLFTAVGIMQLVEDGLVDLEEDIRVYLPEFTTYNKNGDIENISVRQLLNHSSGLKPMVPQVFQWLHLDGDEMPEVTEFFNNRIVDDFNILKYNPGDDKLYTNTAYITLGAIIESVVDVSYETYIINNIMKPMSLDDTTFYRDEKQKLRTPDGSNAFLDINTVLIKIFGKKGILKDYVKSNIDGRIYFKQFYTDFSPSTGLSGTASELAEFGNMILNGGGYQSQSILEKATIEEMLGDVTLDDLPNEYSDDSKVLNGLGFKSWNLNGAIAYGHSGGGPGFGNMFAIVPSKDIVYVVIGTDTNIDRNLMIRLLDGVNW